VVSRHGYTPSVAFPCPACGLPVDSARPRWLFRCPRCGRWLRGRPAETSGPNPTFEVEVAGRPETRRRVEVPWDAADRRRLSAWLLVASVATLALVLVLLLVARLL
jgi:hypothetical protein